MRVVYRDKLINVSAKQLAAKSRLLVNQYLDEKYTNRVCLRTIQQQ
ncbi:hypothetical protein AC69_1340 [Escherichia coli 2-177-06_S4_C1]|nr:hypothetical protein AC69_1340 [Escherichia coli 2-177-06_S4_C1]